MVAALHGWWMVTARAGGVNAMVMVVALVSIMGDPVDGGWGVRCATHPNLPLQPCGSLRLMVGPALARWGFLDKEFHCLEAVPLRSHHMHF